MTFSSFSRESLYLSLYAIFVRSEYVCFFRLILSLLSLYHSISYLFFIIRAEREFSRSAPLESRFLYWVRLDFANSLIYSLFVFAVGEFGIMQKSGERGDALSYNQSLMEDGGRGCLAAIGRPRLTPKGSFVPIPASLSFPPAACFLFLSLIISPSQSLHAPISILYFARFPPWLLRFQFLLVGVDTIDFFKNERQSAATSRSGVGGASHSNRSNRMVKGEWKKAEWES